MVQVTFISKHWQKFVYGEKSDYLAKHLDVPCIARDEVLEEDALTCRHSKG